MPFEPIEYVIAPPVDDAELNTLFASAWEDHRSRPFKPVLGHSLVYVCAYDGDRLVGFVNIAWDGGKHAFVLDPTVHREYQRRRIATKLLDIAASRAAERGCEWLHVDYDSHLEPFYRRCGFRHAQAGLLNLRERQCSC